MFNRVYNEKIEKRVVEDLNDYPNDYLDIFLSRRKNTDTNRTRNFKGTSPMSSGLPKGRSTHFQTLLCDSNAFLNHFHEHYKITLGAGNAHGTCSLFPLTLLIFFPFLSLSI